ncbi:hypothetical protein MTsPCn7_06690 [Altererythrobacter sp. MTPC7]
MAETHVISALVDKRARIDGEIQARRYQITRLELELAHIDAVIRMFRPSYDIAKIATKRTIKRSKAGTVRGSGTREAVTILRESGKALTTRQISERILEKRGEPYCRDTVAKLGVNIHGSLSRRTDGAIVRDASVYPARWSIAPQ